MNSKKCEDRRARSRRTALAGAAIFFAAGTILACGPDFPNQLLDRGDESLLAAPVANFQLELKRMDLLPPKYRAIISTNEFPAATADTDLTDLREALKRAASPDVEEIVSNHQAERDKLTQHLNEIAAWEKTGEPDWIDEKFVLKKTTPRPTLDAAEIVAVDGLPGEFKDYFEGAIAWHAGQTNEARDAWEKLLELPAAQRHYRTTWAAYMLGRSWEDEDADKAVEYFQKTRSLASSGFADHLGLAVASQGREARLDLRQKKIETAIGLYLEQLSAGDESAINSLHFAAELALKQDAGQLAALAHNPSIRQVITAYIISNRREWAYDDDDEEFKIQSKTAWLDAMEAANVHDVKSAEQLALAAYQAGQWEIAQRWINRAPETPTAQWLQAKLLLHDGKLDQAAKLLASVVKLFPPQVPDPDGPVKPGLKDSLSVGGFTYMTNHVSAPSEILGELGVLRLARREYTESLDALLRSGFWMDAAYVAERVLTTDELKAYVDRSWPPSDEPVDAPADGSFQINPREKIRYLLARRLTRLERAEEARAYFPESQLTNFDAFENNLKTGWDESLAKETRGRALFEAAKLAATNGMELLGTEIGPDWSSEGGDFDETSPSAEVRATNSLAGMPLASADEIRRAEEQGANPEKRFHYRYQAASLAWEAAKLMPNNSDETAVILCRGGSWLKARDPETADFFYKSLVRRCRKTAIGDQADRMRWFPVLDDNDQPYPWHPQPIEDSAEAIESNEARAKTDGGYWYVLRHGNSLQDVADAVRTNHGLTVTTRYILASNPGADPARLPIGRKIFVPLPQPESPAQ